MLLNERKRKHALVFTKKLRARLPSRSALGYERFVVALGVHLRTHIILMSPPNTDTQGCLLLLYSFAAYHRHYPQDENTQRLGPADLPSQGIPITVEGTIPVANSGTARIIAVTPTSSGSINPFFERDAADVLHWMRNAIETIHVDSLVVTSAASLALHYLRLGAPRGLAQPRSRSTNDATSASRTISGRLRMGSGARKNRRSNMKQRKVKSKRITDPVSRVSARLLSVTTLTLASKYHDVYEKAVQDFGARVEPSRIYRLGKCEPLVSEG